MSKSPRRALIVEDEQMAQIILQILLESLGYDVVIAKDGREALLEYEQNPFPLILMDFNLPHLDGLAATRIIRSLNNTYQNDNTECLTDAANPKESQTDHEPLRPIIVGVTAYADETYLQKGIEAGMNTVLSKPIASIDLENMLTAIG